MYTATVTHDARRGARVTLDLPATLERPLTRARLAALVVAAAQRPAPHAEMGIEAHGGIAL